MPKVLFLLVFFFVTGCSTVNVLQSEQMPGQLSGQAAALAESGPFQYELESGEHRGGQGCAVAYEVYRPSGGAGKTMVFLAHGFLRDLGTMRGWAEHWASHGVDVTVMSLCNSSVLVGRHDRNAEDMITLAGKLHDGPVIYAGFSAGGLAAHIAAVNDPRTVGYLGLDSVDHKGFARAMKPGVAYPGLLLLAEPSACNLKNNILESIDGAAEYRAIQINNSTHCHFEYPYDAKCEIACGAVRPLESQLALIETIRSLATTWILEQTAEGNSPRQTSILSQVANGEWPGRAEIVH